jgi:4-hydroxybenzoate polyprenyltransferase
LSLTAAPVETPAHTLRPICVDLDGTLVKSDTLVDSLLVLARSKPALLLKLPGRLLHGKAAFKAFVTDSVSLDVAHLPYNHKLLQYLQQQRTLGRKIYLATGADQRLARLVAAHLNLFAGVLGSDGATNLTGSNKLASLRQRLGAEAFDYIGNDTPDLPLLANSAEPMIANPSLRLRMRIRMGGIKPVRTFLEGRSIPSALLKALRPHQWAKNLLIFLPLFLSHALSAGKLLIAFGAFVCFSLTASATYIVNDLLDIQSDRHHPRKRERPFASGDLSVPTGIAIAAGLLAASFAGAQLLPSAFFGWLLLYLATTIAYSTFLKRVALVDVIVLSGLYTLRMLAGGGATQTPISHWLAGFSIFLFLSLGIVKRFAELENLRSSGLSPRNGRGYLIADLGQIRSFGTSSAFAAAVVFANYISSRDVQELYHKPGWLWLIVPLMVLWLCRVWLLASRGELDEDPVVFALTDRTSLLIGAAVALVVLLAM